MQLLPACPIQLRSVSSNHPCRSSRALSQGTCRVRGSPGSCCNATLSWQSAGVRMSEFRGFARESCSIRQRSERLEIWSLVNDDAAMKWLVAIVACSLLGCGDAGFLGSGRDRDITWRTYEMMVAPDAPAEPGVYFAGSDSERTSHLSVPPRVAFEWPVVDFPTESLAIVVLPPLSGVDTNRRYAPGAIGGVWRDGKRLEFEDCRDVRGVQASIIGPSEFDVVVIPKKFARNPSGLRACDWDAYDAAR